MRNLYFPENAREVAFVLEWVAERIGERPDIFHEPYAYALVDHEKGVLAGFVLHDYSGKNISFSTAIMPGTILTPRLAHNVMRVPFNSPLDACRVTAFVDETNTRSVRLIQTLGFKEEGRIRKHFGDHDALVFGLLKEEFDGGRYGRRYERGQGRGLREPDAGSGELCREVPTVR